MDRLLPYLMTAGAVIEADRLIDVQTLAWPVLAAIVACAGLRLIRKEKHS